MDPTLSARLFGYCILLLPILLLSEVLLLRAHLSAARLRALLGLDIAYNSGIYLTIAAALVHIIWFGRELADYLGNLWLYVALGLLLLLSMLSLVPLTLYAAWRSKPTGEEPFRPGAMAILLLRLCLLLEVAVVLALGHLARLIEQGPPAF